MAVRKNPDGSITVGILDDEPQEKSEVKAEQPKAEKPKKGKAKNKGEE